MEDGLTPDQKQFFLDHGYVHVQNCFDSEAQQRKDDVKSVWSRVRFSETESSTWSEEYCVLPLTRYDPSIKDVSRKAWAAVCDIVGGEDRILSGRMGDDLIINLGTHEQAKAWKAAETNQITEDGSNTYGLSTAQKILLHPAQDPHKCEKWHVDGDHFVHYLDSGDQAVVMIVLWTDIDVGQGPTVLATDSIEPMARYLYDHPEGVCENLSSAEAPTQDCTAFYNIASQCKGMAYATGKAGDIYLVHPLIVHSVSPNFLRVPRIVTSPLVKLKEPLQLQRESPDHYSLVEKKILLALGKENGLDDWHIFGPRKDVAQITPRQDRPPAMNGFIGDFGHLNARQRSKDTGAIVAC